MAHPSPRDRTAVKLHLYIEMGFSEPRNDSVPELFLPSKAFHFESTLNTASDFPAGNSLGIMDFLVVQVGNEFHKQTGENALPFVGRRIEKGKLRVPPPFPEHSCKNQHQASSTFRSLGLLRPCLSPVDSGIN